MAIRVNYGTIEEVLVTVGDRSGEVVDLTGSTPTYSVYDAHGNVYGDLIQSGTPTIVDHMGLLCLLTTTIPTAVLTSDGTNVSNNDTVTIGDTSSVDTGRTYTFKTTLTPAANEVLIGASAAASLSNLKDAINLEGNPGVTYGGATVPLLTIRAVTVTSTVLTLKGYAEHSDLFVSTEASSHLSFGAATFQGSKYGAGLTYNLYASFTEGSETPLLGPIEIQMSNFDLN